MIDAVGVERGDGRGIEREPMTQAELITQLQRNWTLDTDGAAMYKALADRDRIPERRTVFQKLSDLEKKHADQWAQRIRDLGGDVPVLAEGQAHGASVADAPGGMQGKLQAIEAEERRDVAAYLKQFHEMDDEESRVILREVVLDEFTHSHVVNRLYAQSSPRSALDYLARRQRQGTGSWIGDAVYGVNDGLGAIFGIVSGVSGATLNSPTGNHAVLIAGLAGLVASALSMGSGAYLAAKSEKEIYEAELHHEKQALEEHPEAAKEELAIFYQLKGVPEKDANNIAEFLAASPEQFLKTIAAEKLNLTEDGLSNPVTSAVSGSISTAVGALIPILPFFFMHGIPAVVAAAVVSLVAHFAVGAAKSLVTVRSWWSSGWEMTLIGVLEGVVTYVIGVGLGHLGVAGG